VREIALVATMARMSGVEFSTLYLVQHLDRSRWQPLLICPEEGDLTEGCRAAGAAVAIVPAPAFTSIGIRVANRVLPNPIAMVSDVFKLVAGARTLAGFLKAHKPDVVVTKGLFVHLYGGLAAKISGIPCVWHVQDRVSERAGPCFRWGLSLAGRFLACQAIADADTIARQLQTLMPRERISVIWNGVDVNEFGPQVDGSSVRREWGVEPGDLLIGVMARVTPWKGQHLLIEAFARIAARFPKTYVVIVGAPMFDDDAYLLRLKSETTCLQLDGRVIFAGFRRDTARTLAALDVFVHTALEKDSSPLAVVSAMASGKPIVCAQIDGTAQLLEDGTSGMLFPPGDAGALAEKLELVLSDAGLRRKLGQAARERAERELSAERFTRQCEAVFERACP
jgi:glycosyltransferase involved in cell wall biosynthesis